MRDAELRIKREEIQRFFKNLGVLTIMGSEHREVSNWMLDFKIKDLKTDQKELDTTKQVQE